MRRGALFASLLTLACQVARAPQREPSQTPAKSSRASAPAATGSSGFSADISRGSVSVLAGTGGAGVLQDSPPPRAQQPCPPEMALVERPQGRFCIDRWEATLLRSSTQSVSDLQNAEPWPPNLPIDGRESEMIAASAPGRQPQGYINGEQAERACVNANKRLCSIDEWVRACRGPRGTTYPYGDERRAEVCNDRYKGQASHPVVTLFERFAPPGMDRARMWEPDWMNDPRLHELPNTVEPTGKRAGCASEYGVFDLVGNLHEWVADPDGTFVGGFFMDTLQNGEGCAYRTSAHTRRYHDYSTGFRCCRDALLQ